MSPKLRLARQVKNTATFGGGIFFKLIMWYGKNTKLLMFKRNYMAEKIHNILSTSQEREVVDYGDLSETEINEILKDELKYFDIPFELREVAQESVEAEDSLMLTDELITDNPRLINGMPIKVFRSKSWTPVVTKDQNFKHQVRYYAGLSDVCREFLPDELIDILKKVWEKIKQKYPVMTMSEERNNYLVKKVLMERSATEEEKQEYEAYCLQRGLALDDYYKVRKAIILKSPLIEKKIISFQNPLVIEDYDYDPATAFCRAGIKDFRYISEEEVAGLKKQGYDGIIIKQYTWFVVF